MPRLSRALRIADPDPRGASCHHRGSPCRRRRRRPHDRGSGPHGPRRQSRARSPARGRGQWRRGPPVCLRFPILSCAWDGWGSTSRPCADPSLDVRRRAGAPDLRAARARRRGRRPRGAGRGRRSRPSSWRSPPRCSGARPRFAISTRRSRCAAPTSVRARHARGGPHPVRAGRGPLAGLAEVDLAAAAAERELLLLHAEREAAVAEMNRLLGRPAATPCRRLPIRSPSRSRIPRRPRIRLPPGVRSSRRHPPASRR